jgi:hypothetical protein
MIDFFATERHFVDHLAPIWLALPASSRGEFVVRPKPSYNDERTNLADHARSLGLTISESLPLVDRPMVTASMGNLKRARKMGRSRVALVEHGSGQSFGGDPRSARQPSYPGGRDRPASLFVAPNTHAAGRDAAAYPTATTAVVGCPKLDTLPDPAPMGARPVVAVSFRWDCSVCAETRSGWREFYNAVVGLTNRFHVIGHGHPRMIDELSREYRRYRIEVVRDFREVVARANVYVNEGSSTLYEAATRMPVVVLNPSFFRRSVIHGLRFWDAAEVGINVRSRGTWDHGVNKTLYAAVEEALADAPERKAAREAALGIVYTHRTGAAKRAAKAIGEWAARKPEMVAA